jgi:hypothetical protein
VAVQDVGRNDDHCATSDRRPGKLVGATCNAVDRSERRIEPQRLLDNERPPRSIDQAN